MDPPIKSDAVIAQDGEYGHPMTLVSAKTDLWKGKNQSSGRAEVRALVAALGEKQSLL